MHSDTGFLSSSLIRRVIVICGALAALLTALNFGMKWYGDRIIQAGHTTSTDEVEITIGNDRLKLAKNTLRNPSDRDSGAHERADLYLTWPDLAGYRDSNRALFDDPKNAVGLIFVQLSQSTMSQDMSGRFEPIYTRLIEGEPTPLKHGLLLHRLRADSGYGKEVILTGRRDGESVYVVRCLLPQTPQETTGSDCQRDIHVGQDLSLFYRFSANLLPQWQALDAAVTRYVEKRLVKDENP
ncbi:hypothetical protein CFBP5875_06115 [Agrobacterium pusense]|jgi:hypothetical protein|uniref:Transmembrane anchored protein n=1 Tax=Agrobacterium pusense TaxID=648995 RepID=A0A1S9EBY4_9HYPH|nr:MULTISPECIES: hypothetical protein [Agrobacterium]ANV22829.1 hypothetical protein BA939_01995 [Rhizobium sp. S41]AUC09683.1 hypothetical protein BLX90_05385 [Rhizobium sp. Y9]KGE84752.1 membrane protein [Rhizobium sp. H41]KIV61459.1 hypothetical protein SZ54_4731 [Rhizobium sp. UR51a]MDP9733176.1 hypothetical protein [Rhizobium sp. SORGH_AS_0285]MDP9754995.1 hypothetical protein [Rhizobium sp. SORGH_AS_0260]MDP9776226.1 hypothetical protein [Rhizobium sp. SORGH_AS_0755]OAI89884.1 hypothe